MPFVFGRNMESIKRHGRGGFCIVEVQKEHTTVKQGRFTGTRRHTSHADVQTCGYGAPTQNQGRIGGNL